MLTKFRAHSNVKGGYEDDGTTYLRSSGYEPFGPNTRVRIRKQKLVRTRPYRDDQLTR